MKAKTVTKTVAGVIILALFLAGCATAPSNPADFSPRTDAAFAAIAIGKDTQHTVRATFGPPDETTYLALRDLQVWSYRYRQQDVWYSMMHIHFDRNGIVRELQSGPDPERDEHHFGW